MTTPGSAAAAVWVDVLPDMSNFGARLVREAAGVGGNAGERLGDEMGRNTQSGFSRHIGKIVAVGAAAGAALGVALVGALNVEKAQGKLNAQLNLSAKDAERYGRVAGDLYSNNYGDSLETVNEALRQVTLNVGASATSSDADLQRITASVLDVATAFDQDLGGTTAAVGQLMKTGLATDATQALDIITAGFQVGVDKSGDFLDTLNEYGGQFQKLGIDGATATGILSQGLQGGARDADQVADSLKEFAIRAVDGSETTAAGFRMLGLDGAQMAQAIARGGPEASAALQLVTDELRALPDPLQRSQAAAALFGTQSEDMAAALLTIDPSKAAAGLGDLTNRTVDLTLLVNSSWVCSDLVGVLCSFRPVPGS
jgi:phage-related minor tail protein